jgi:hypothetical protein
MKKVLQITLSALLLVTLTFESCDKIAKNVVKPLTYSWTGASMEVMIPPATDTANVQIAGVYNIDSLIKSQSSLAQFSDLTSVKVTNITLTLNNADAQNNFANFQYVLASFNSDAGTFPAYGLAVIQDNPDAFASTLSLPPTDPTQNVKQYFAPKTNIVYLLVGKLRRPTTHNLDCTITVTYDIGLF